MPRTVASTSPEVKLPPDQVFDTLCRIGRVFGLNPHWTVRYCSVSPDAHINAGSVIFIEFEDYATSEIWSLKGTCRISEPSRQLELVFEGSHKLSTAFLVSESLAGSRFTVEETYSDDEDPDKFEWYKEQLDFWVRSLAAYLRLREDKGWKARLYLWFMDRFWISASPSGRRISIALFKISIIELVLILAILVMWALFFQR